MVDQEIDEFDSNPGSPGPTETEQTPQTDYNENTPDSFDPNVMQPEPSGVDRMGTQPLGNYAAMQAQPQRPGQFASQQDTHGNPFGTVYPIDTQPRPAIIHDPSRFESRITAQLNLQIHLLQSLYQRQALQIQQAVATEVNRQLSLQLLPAVNQVVAQYIPQNINTGAPAGTPSAAPNPAVIAPVITQSNTSSSPAAPSPTDQDADQRKRASKRPRKSGRASEATDDTPQVTGCITNQFHMYDLTSGAWYVKRTGETSRLSVITASDLIKMGERVVQGRAFEGKGPFTYKYKVEGTKKDGTHNLIGEEGIKEWLGNIRAYGDEWILKTFAVEKGQEQYSQDDLLP